MLTPDFPLPLLLGLAEQHLRRRKRLRLDAPVAKPGPASGTASTRPPAMFVPTGRYANPLVDVSRPTGRAPSRRLDVPDGLDIRVRGSRLYLPLAQLYWSAGTPPVATKDGTRVWVALGKRFVLRLLGTKQRWVFDVNDRDAALYEDRSLAVLPFLGRPPAESWALTMPCPTWLATVLEEVADGGDDLSPFLAVGLLIRHVGVRGAGASADRLLAGAAGFSMPVAEAAEWLRAVADGVELGPLVGEACARADSLAMRIVASEPSDIVVAVTICREREQLECIALALRTLRRGATLSRRLAAVDALAEERLAHLKAALAGVHDLPAEVAFAPIGWWAIAA